ncbi:MAG TPA: hypothetical protein VFA90_07555 [Terriglobales bacterium]|nr:hypothetical protein [Terriglobales bacterium]
MIAAANFSWEKFFWRIIGGYFIVLLWIIRDIRRHEPLGISAAIVTGTVLSVLCYQALHPNKTLPRRDILKGLSKTPGSSWAEAIWNDSGPADRTVGQARSSHPENIRNTA